MTPPRWHTGLLLIAAAAAPAEAQRIAGVVTDRQGNPIGGALLGFVTSAGRLERQVLADSLGAFVVATRDTGRYQVRVSHVGFADWEGAVFAGIEGPGVVLSADAEPLPALAVDTAPAACGAPPPGSSAARLITDGRTALATVRTTYAMRLLAIAVEQFERRLNRQRRVQDSTRATGLGGAWPLATFPDTRLQASGFVEVRPDETWVYAAPGPETLFSTWFVERHCWAVRQAPGVRDAVTLEFTPRGAEGQLSGRLLFDQATGMLRSADWQYERLPLAELRGQASGSFALRRLPSGSWYVEAWLLRIPVVERDPRGSTRVTGYLERGGHVVQVRPGQADQPGDRQP